MLFGFTSSFRMGQLLRYALTVPTHHADIAIDCYMATTFIDAVRECLKNHGFAEKHDEAERGGVFLVGYRGRLFYIDSDYQVGQSVDGYHAVGCGGQIAHGALYATAHLPAAERVSVALAAAQRWSAGVRSPFHVESLEATA
jgi:ATP-dependent protease HslVU (ClpYQ) peptidase subunit